MRKSAPYEEPEQSGRLGPRREGDAWCISVLSVASLKPSRLPAAERASSIGTVFY